MEEKIGEKGRSRRQKRRKSRVSRDLGGLIWNNVGEEYGEGQTNE